MQNIFIGNLAANTSEQKLRQIFEAFGEVLSVNLAIDRDTGGPRGFAFIEMSNDTEAERAIAEIDGTTIDERTVQVNEARPKQAKGSDSSAQMRRHRRHRY